MSPKNCSNYGKHTNVTRRKLYKKLQIDRFNHSNNSTINMYRAVSRFLRLVRWKITDSRFPAPDRRR